MIAYGRRKIRTNFKDHHPKRDYANWWEVECNYINKKAERRKARKDIVNQLTEITFLTSHTSQ